MLHFKTFFSNTPFVLKMPEHIYTFLFSFHIEIIHTFYHFSQFTFTL